MLLALLRSSVFCLTVVMTLVSTTIGTAQEESIQQKKSANGTAAQGGVARPSAPLSLADIVSKSKRLLFLGDSITFGGPYVSHVETWLTIQNRESRPFVINGGLPSETVSGLSEEGHAGGQFPRPDLAERLERVLKVAKPDVVIACYGMNCGIYEPFDQDRFQRYQAGIKNLKANVEKSGATLILVTPPFYDDLKAPKKFSYNEVLDRYSEWLLAQRKSGWWVIDLHGPMSKEIARRRKDSPSFTLQPDGVHPNEAGYWLVAAQLIAGLGDESVLKYESGDQMLEAHKLPVEFGRLVASRNTLIRDAYVGAAGHKRPGIAPGLPIPEAEAKAAELMKQVQGLLADKPR